MLLALPKEDFHQKAEDIQNEIFKVVSQEQV